MRRRRRQIKNSVIHVPATIAGSITSGNLALNVIASPSLDAAESASSNIEAQDKDRTVNVGHHMGAVTIDHAVRNTTADGAIEYCVLKVERDAGTPAIGTHPIPSAATVTSIGLQQAARIANPGKVFHYSKRAYSTENTLTHKIRVSPPKFKESKCKAGTYWVLLVYNRGSASVTYDFEARYKEYE